MNDRCADDQCDALVRSDAYYSMDRTLAHGVCSTVEPLCSAINRQRKESRSRYKKADMIQPMERPDKEWDGKIGGR